MPMTEELKSNVKSAIPSSWTITELPRAMVEFGGPKDWKGIEIMRSIGATFNPSTLKWKISVAKLEKKFQSAMDDKAQREQERQDKYNADRIARYKQYAKDSASDGVFATKSMAELKTLMKEADYKTFADYITAQVASNSKAQTASKKNYDMKRLYLLSDIPSADSYRKVGSDWFLVLFIGRDFRVDDDTASIDGRFAGREGERCAYAYMKRITDTAEIAQRELELQNEKDEAKRRDDERKEKEQTKRELIDTVLTKGVPMPTGSTIPTGEVLWDDMNIYGGGSTMIRKDGVYYYIVNNGSDGADWSRNNVRTGGAGAIGTMYSETGDADRMQERFAKFCALFKTGKV